MSLANTTVKIAQGIRNRVFEHTIQNNGGYLSQACSSAELLAVMYNEVLNIGPSVAPMIPKHFQGTPSAHNKNSFTGAGYHGEKNAKFDRFFISPAHYALVIYTALIETGRMSPEGLKMFNKDGSSVEMIGAEHSPGMEVTNGSLAQALSIAAGVAWARKKKNESGLVWVFISDGELQEGQTWECLENSVFQKLDNLRIIVDCNRQQCDGAMNATMDIGNIVDKLKSFGVETKITNGHDIKAIKDACSITPIDKPLIVLCETCPYQGINYLEKRFPRLHYVRFKSNEERAEANIQIAENLGIESVKI